MRPVKLPARSCPTTMRSLRQKLADLPFQGQGQRRDPVRTTAGAPTPDARPGDDEPITIERRVVIEESITVVEETFATRDDAIAGMGPSDVRAPSAGMGPRDARAPIAKVEAGAKKPSLDELRERIAALVGHREPPKPRPDPSAGDLPFFVERTASGPRYVRRVRAAPAARVGRAPLVAARDADPTTLSLLALDPAIAGCDPRKALYLDTETTGLAGGTGTVAFLVGLAFFDEEHGAFVLEQMLLRRLGEEAPILELVERRLAEASMVVTYNGKAFDVPLLRARFVMNRMRRPAEPPHLDLLHVARRVHKHRLASCTLATIEDEVLGRGRVGDVSGMDIVEAYMHYLRTGDERLLHGVVTHNEHDVLAMVALLGLYGEPFGVVAPPSSEPSIPSHRALSPAPELAADLIAPVAAGPLAADLVAPVAAGSLAADLIAPIAAGPLVADLVAPITAGTPSIDPDFETGVRLRADAPCGLGAGLSAIDLAGVARTLHRAGAIDRAQALAGEAVRAGGGTLARRVSADIHRERGDTEAALHEYELLLVEQPDPEVRLVLAKMYEHRLRAYDRALALLADGTTESDEATTLRRARLEKKLRTAAARLAEGTAPRRTTRAKRRKSG